MSNVNCFLRWYLILFLTGLLLASAWVCRAATPGTRIEIEIRGKNYPATIEKPPLLKKNT